MYCVLIHSSFCVLNFILTTCRPNFAEVGHITLRFEQTWHRWSNMKALAMTMYSRQPTHACVLEVCIAKYRKEQLLVPWILLGSVTGHHYFRVTHTR